MSGFWELLVLDPGPRGPGASWTRGVVGGYPCSLTPLLNWAPHITIIIIIIIILIGAFK